MSLAFLRGVALKIDIRGHGSTGCVPCVKSKEQKDTTQEECKDRGRDQYSPGHPQQDPRAEEAEKQDSR